MNRTFSILNSSLLMATVCCTMGSQASARAGSIGFRNEMKIPVVVQGVGIVNNVLVQGRRHTLQPGGICYERIVAPGTKTITVVDARQPTRILYKGTINFVGGDMFYSIQAATAQAPSKNSDADPATPSRGTASRRPAPLRAELVATAPPMASPASPAPPPRFKPSSSKSR
jgi:hypothetical protein